jgi:hypothetical protein
MGIVQFTGVVQLKKVLPIINSDTPLIMQTVHLEQNQHNILNGIKTD